MSIFCELRSVNFLILAWLASCIDFYFIFVSLENYFYFTTEINSVRGKKNDSPCLLSQAPFWLLGQASHIFSLGNFSKQDIHGHRF